MTKTPNQIVATNLRIARRAMGWTQAECGQHLGGVTKQAIASAEGAARQDARPRRFDADELRRFEEVFGLPVSWWLTEHEHSITGLRDA